MLPDDDAFALAVARHGTGPWVRCARISVRWLSGRSLGPIRRSSGCHKLRDRASAAAAVRAAFAAVDAAALLQAALSPYAGCVVEFSTEANSGNIPCAFTCGSQRWDLCALGVPPNARVAWCVETAAAGGVPPTSCPRQAFTNRMLALMPPRRVTVSLCIHELHLLFLFYFHRESKPSPCASPAPGGRARPHPHPSPQIQSTLTLTLTVPLSFILTLKT